MTPKFLYLALVCSQIALPLLAQSASTQGASPRPKKVARQPIEKGLDWLAAHQDEDGKWDVDGFMKHDDRAAKCDGAGSATHDVGVTGLVLLAYLGHGNTTVSGPHKDVVSRAAHWLVKQQAESGLIGSAQSLDFIYDHAIASWALIETHGLGKTEAFKAAGQRALDYLESHRNPGAVWRYRPRDGDNDTSITSWCTAAYESGKHFGLKVNPSYLKSVARYFDRIADSETGRHGYSKRGEGSSRMPGDHAQRFPPDRYEALTAAALFARYFMGQDPKHHPIMDKAAALVASKAPRWDIDDGSIDYYAWYWSSKALYQAGGEHWKQWSTPMRMTLEQGQAKEGSATGSWPAVGVWGRAGGRVYSTAMAILILETSHRFNRIVR